MKIQVNEQSMGKPENPYFLSPCKHWNAKQPDTYCAVDDASCNCALLDSFDNAHTELLCLTPIGEKVEPGSYECGEAVWQYYSNAGVWITYQYSEDFYLTVQGYETRQVYFVTTPANESNVQKTHVANEQPKEEKSIADKARKHAEEVTKLCGYTSKSFISVGAYKLRAKNSYQQGYTDAQYTAPSLAPVDESVKTPVELEIEADWKNCANKTCECNHPDECAFLNCTNKFTPPVDESVEERVRKYVNSFGRIDDPEDCPTMYESYIAGATDQLNECLKEHVRVDDVDRLFDDIITAINSFEITGDVEADEDLYNQGLERGIREINKLRNLLRVNQPNTLTNN